jgi:hypothetical protein
MKVPYENLNPSAGVVSYEMLEHAILLEFRGGRFRYLYDATKPGAAHVAKMKRLALAGRGLTTYISQHVRENYAARLPLDIRKDRY